jgi:hypothetical protein
MRKVFLTTLLGCLLFPFLANRAECQTTIADSPVTFDKAIGFTKGEDKIASYSFFDSGNKVVIFGEKQLQIWDVRQGKLLNSTKHNIDRFAPSGFLKGIAKMFTMNWNPVLIDPNGKWMMTLEKEKGSKIRVGVVRSLSDAKETKRIETPNMSVDWASFNDDKTEIETYGKTNDVAVLAAWDVNDLSLKRSITITDYDWHQDLSGLKMIVGTGGTDSIWFWDKQGNVLTLRDARTGEIEKSYSAEGFDPKSSYRNTTVSSDERLLFSTRDSRILVWKIAGDGKPLYEVTANKENGMSFSQVIGRDHFALMQGKSLQVYAIAGDGKPLYTLSSENPNDSMQIAAVTKDGKYIAVADDTSVALFETNGDGDPIFKIAHTNANERFRPIEFVKNDSLLAVGRHNRTDKWPAKTQIYELGGKLVYDLEFLAEDDLQLSPDEKYIYTEFLGGTYVMNIPDKKRLYIPVEIHTPSNIDYEGNTTNGTPENVDRTTPNSSFRFILKHRGDVTAVYDSAAGKEVQVLLDPAKVKYDKKNKVKKSALDDAFWAEDESYIYALDDKRHVMLFWNVKE